MIAQHGTTHHHASAQASAGLSLSADGDVLTQVGAPEAVGEPGTLSLQILDATGEPLLAYRASHEKELHLIVVRSDGGYFRHVHPDLDTATGTWSTPWRWDAAGTYRVYADFVPDVEHGPEHVTLTSAVDVAGQFSPARAAGQRTTDRVDGFVVSIEGSLVAGSMQDLTVEVTRGGKPVTDLQPYLGSFGHLVALRAGDLAYMHVHAQGQAPQAGERSGPRIAFAAEAPIAGRYLLYLDFQVDGRVRTASLALDATRGDAANDTNPHGR
jgi:hypothetical protein